MMTALIFWTLAVYGALVIVWQGVGRIQRKYRPHSHPLTIILIVQNAESEIEGVLRTLMMKTALGRRERRILVFDVASSDDTGEITERMTLQHDGLDYICVADEVEFLERLKTICLQCPRVGCIYDLRISGMSQDVTQDVIWLTQ